jgi:hypothetical protein
MNVLTSTQCCRFEDAEYASVEAIIKVSLLSALKRKRSFGIFLIPKFFCKKQMVNDNNNEIE